MTSPVDARSAQAIEVGKVVGKAGDGIVDGGVVAAVVDKVPIEPAIDRHQFLDLDAGDGGGDEVGRELIVLLTGADRRAGAAGNRNGRAGLQALVVWRAADRGRAG